MSKIQEFDYSVDLLSVILWQYDKATNLLSLLNDKQSWWDTNQTQFWENWYTQVFNLSATNNQMTQFGLAVWSIILNVPLFVPIEETAPGVVWGFNAFAPSFPDFENANLNFENAPFPPSSAVINLTIPQQQFLLLLKYFNCTTRGTISTPIEGTYPVDPLKPERIPYNQSYIYNINQYLQYLCFYLGVAIGYPGETIYCYDNLDMTISYVFSNPGLFPIDLLNAINTLDLFPRPSGVRIV